MNVNKMVFFLARFLAEILYIFKDKFGQAWVENRWLYNKDEVLDTVPKSRRANGDFDRALFLL